MAKRKDKIATDLARSIWRLKDYCEYCHKTKDQVQLQGAHIYGVGAYPRLRDDLRNRLSLCATDHRMFTDNPLAFADWIRTTEYAEYLQPLMEKNRAFEKRFWEERIVELKSIKKAIKNNEMTQEEARLYI